MLFKFNVRFGTKFCSKRAFLENYTAAEDKSKMLVQFLLEDYYFAFRSTASGATRRTTQHYFRSHNK